MRLEYIVAVLLFMLISGCAIGNRYNYDSASVDLPVSGSGLLGVGVTDQRPYILNGDKTADFVGLQRGGYGNPFDVTTDTGNALSADMATAMSSELGTNGFEILQLYISSPDRGVIVKAVQNSGANRSVVLTLHEWKTDAMMNFGLSYDLSLEVFDASGTSLGSAEISGGKEKLGGAGLENANSIAAGNAFSAKLSKLFDSPAIREALVSDDGGLLPED